MHDQCGWNCCDPHLSDAELVGSRVERDEAGGGHRRKQVAIFIESSIGDFVNLSKEKHT